jgi:SOS response regulatory protein OraA/RecX
MRMGDHNVQTETPEDLRKELLNRGYSESIVEKIVAHYTKGSESY